MEEEVIILHILIALPTEYHALRIRAQSMTLMEIQDLLLIKEHQIILRSEDNSSLSGNIQTSAFTASHSSTESQENKTTKQGKYRGKGRDKYGYQKLRLYCQIFRKPSHSAADCFHLLDQNYPTPVQQQQVIQGRGSSSNIPGFATRCVIWMVTKFFLHGLKVDG